MKVGFCGLGKLGLPCALAIESKGHQIFGFDVSDFVKDIIRTRKIPYREAGAQEMLTKSKILFASLDNVVRNSDLIFIAVQTPHDPLYEGITRLPDSRVDFDYSYLKSAVSMVSESLDRLREKRTVIIMSTVLPTTIESQIKPLLSKYAQLCYNPFFIAMGTTIQDFLYPEFVLFGVDDPDALEKAKKFYKTITDAPFCEMSIVNAELTKVTYNTFITMKTIFGNNLMEVAHKLGGNSDVVMGALKHATRRIISPAYMYGGMADSGPCHARDNIALSYLARKLNLETDLYDSVMVTREKQTEWLAKLIISEKSNMPVMILGKAYKPETNLTVGSSAVLLKNILDEYGVQAGMFDPHVDQTEDQIKRLEFFPHLVFIGTKHEIFRDYKFAAGSTVIDPFRYISKQDNVKLVSVGNP